MSVGRLLDWIREPGPAFPHNQLCPSLSAPVRSRVSRRRSLSVPPPAPPASLSASSLSLTREGLVPGKSNRSLMNFMDVPGKALMMLTAERRHPVGLESLIERSVNLFPRRALVRGLHETRNAHWWDARVTWQLTPLSL